MDCARLAVVLLGLSGCDPGFTLGGRAKTLAGEGIMQGEALVVCKGGVTFAQAVITENGTFSAFRLGGCDDDCEVIVRAAGYESYRARVSRHCTKRASLSRACLSVEVETALTTTVH